VEEERDSENLDDDPDLLNADQMNQMGGIDQEQLT
jgi:HD superfamily phosphohydrolase